MIAPVYPTHHDASLITFCRYWYSSRSWLHLCIQHTTMLHGSQSADIDILREIWGTSAMRDDQSRQTLLNDISQTSLKGPPRTSKANHPGWTNLVKFIWLGHSQHPHMYNYAHYRSWLHLCIQHTTMLQWSHSADIDIIARPMHDIFQ